MFKYQFIEKAVEVTWMFLTISFLLFIDLWLRIFHSVSILDISTIWVKENLDLPDAIGITVSYSFFMAGAIPGVRFALPLLVTIVYYQLCSAFNWKPLERQEYDLKDYYAHEDELKHEAIKSNNSTLLAVYQEHKKTKENIIKQQTISQSIILMAVIGYFLPSSSKYLFEYTYSTLDTLIWYIDFPLRSLLAGFLIYTFMLCFGDTRQLEYVDRSLLKAANPK